MVWRISQESQDTSHHEVGKSSAILVLRFLVISDKGIDYESRCKLAVVVKAPRQSTFEIEIQTEKIPAVLGLQLREVFVVLHALAKHRLSQELLVLLEMGRLGAEEF